MADPKIEPLDTRIAAALTGSLPSSDIAEILAATKLRQRRIEEDMADAERKATSPILPVTSVRAARDRLSDLQLDRQRSERAITELEARLVERQTAERAQQSAAASEKVIAERDALAARVAERVPVMFAELAELFAQIEDVDSRLPAGATRTEAKARGVPPTFYRPAGGGPITRLTKMTLPAFNGRGTVWPAPKPVIDHSAAYARDRDAARAQRQKEADDRAARLAAHPWREVRQPASCTAWSFDTMEGPRDFMPGHSSDAPMLARMSDAQAAEARAKGFRVDDAPDRVELRG